MVYVNYLEQPLSNKACSRRRVVLSPPHPRKRARVENIGTISRKKSWIPGMAYSG